MRVKRVKKRGPCGAIRSATSKAGRKLRPRIATDDIVSTAARVVGVVDSKLRVVKNIEGFSAELNLAGFPNLEMFQQRQIEVQAARIIQKVPACVAEC